MVDKDIDTAVCLNTFSFKINTHIILFECMFFWERYMLWFWGGGRG
jgi:hypothetical protein